MNQFLSAPVTDAQRQRDALLGALVGLARSTVNEPKTEDTDRVLTSGLRLAADPDAAEDALRRVNSPEISAFPRALHFFSLRCAAHKSGQFLFYQAFFPLFCRNSALRAQKYGDAFSKKHFTNVKEITII